MLKAFGYIERVVKSDLFSIKKPILHKTCAACSELPTYIRTMIPADKLHEVMVKIDILAEGEGATHRTVGTVHLLVRG